MPARTSPPPAWLLLLCTAVLGVNALAGTRADARIGAGTHCHAVLPAGGDPLRAPGCCDDRPCPCTSPAGPPTLATGAAPVECAPLASAPAAPPTPETRPDRLLRPPIRRL